MNSTNRGRKSAANKKTNPADSLIEALKFISVAQKKAGTPQQQFAMACNHWLVASDGVLTVGTKIEEDFEAFPHTLQLLDALGKCSDELSMVQLSQNTLSVRSGPFVGMVACLSPGGLNVGCPDPKCAVLDDRVKQAIKCVSVLATEGATTATYASVLLQAQTAVATNGAALLEAFHGVDLPPGMLLPKQAAKAIGSCKKSLVGFGYSGPSATFYFEDDSFIKTQLFGERYPNYSIVIDVPNLNPWPVPVEFFKAIKAIEPFSKTGSVQLNENGILSDGITEEKSSYKIEGLQENMVFNAKLLLSVQHAFDTAHFDSELNKVFFFGDNCRGVAMGMGQGVSDKKEGTPYTHHNYLQNDEDDDIPF